jgi:hypothetical protein
VTHNFVAQGRMMKELQIGVSSMEAYDLLGPLTRKAVAEALSLWSTKGLFVAHVNQQVPDYVMARTVQQWDERKTANDRAEREARRGIWAPDAQFHPAMDGTLVPYEPPPKRGTAAWLAAATTRAIERSA